jgi:predicted glycosyltransferase
MNPMVWIDVCNSPHVLFFRPIIAELQRRGVRVLITAQDFGQTVGLLDLYRIPYRSIGGQTGKSLLSKGGVTLFRSIRLAWEVRRHHPHLLVSHGSRAGVIAARLLRIPALTLDDYEHSFTRINNVLSTVLLFPAVIPIADLVATGVPQGKVRQYPGFKEEVYLSDYQGPVSKRLPGVPVPDDAVVVLLRPPATTAHYHNEESDRLLTAVLRHLEGHRNAYTLVVCRNVRQREMMESLLFGKERFHVVGMAVDGLELLSLVDLMIGGGGTMNREAALLGIPTYSFFAGEKAAVDRALEKAGLLHFVKTERDVAGIPIRKRIRGGRGRAIGQEGRVAIINEILQMLSFPEGTPA